MKTIEEAIYAVMEAEEDVWKKRHCLCEEVKKNGDLNNLVYYAIRHISKEIGKSTPDYLKKVLYDDLWSVFEHGVAIGREMERQELKEETLL